MSTTEAQATPFPPEGWWALAKHLWRAMQHNRILLVAAGVAFYLLLALFPALVAFLSVYGLFLDPATAADQAAAFHGLVPAAASDLITTQLQRLAAQQSGTLTFGLVLSLVLAFWSTNGGVKAMIEGLNVAYGVQEKRSFLWLNLVALGFTLGAILLMMLILVALAVVPAVLVFLPLGQVGDLLIRFARWPILLAAVLLALAVLYRHGPSRPPPPWRWVTWGSGLATAAWLVTSVAFTIYLEQIADFEASYGALAAPIGLLFWLWLSVVTVLLGAEVNGLIERGAKPAEADLPQGAPAR